MRKFIGATRTGLRGRNKGTELEMADLEKLCKANKVVGHWIMWLGSDSFQKDFPSEELLSISQQMSESRQD